MGDLSKRSQIDQLERDLFAVRSLLSTELRSNSALRGQITRLKKRIMHGRCPFCGCWPINFWRHLEEDHPNMVKKYGVKK